MKIKRKKEKGTEGMVKFIGKRLAYAVLTLFLITTATFFLVAGAPGDPIAAKVGQMPEQAQQIILLCLLTVQCGPPVRRGSFVSYHSAGTQNFSTTKSWSQLLSG